MKHNRFYLDHINEKQELEREYEEYKKFATMENELRNNENRYYLDHNKEKRERIQ